MAFTCGNSMASSMPQCVWSSVSGSYSISSTICDVLLYIRRRFNKDLSICCAVCTPVFNCLHGAAPVYQSTTCQPVSENISRRSLRSARRGDLLFLSQGQRAMVPAASLWSVCQHGTLYQRRCVITYWHWHLSAANLRHSYSVEHTPHQHVRSWLFIHY